MLASYLDYNFNLLLKRQRKIGEQHKKKKVDNDYLRVDNFVKQGIKIVENKKLSINYFPSSSSFEFEFTISVSPHQASTVLCSFVELIYKG